MDDEKSFSVNTWHIHIKGQVQGVGFRPFVFGLAQKHQLSGWVNNSSDGVHIEVNADESKSKRFLKELLLGAPPLSIITDYKIYLAKERRFGRFKIIHSSDQQLTNVLLTPDICICPSCSMELHSPKNARNRYAFISCAHCGPRYSVINSLPYDRGNTTMNKFLLCSTCKQEYHNPLDRRHFAQSISCPKCSVDLKLLAKKSGFSSGSSKDLIQEVVSLWKEGAIIAIKGIGGYILTCDANSKSALKEIRRRKNRPSKPLAIMMPNLDRLIETVNYIPANGGLLGYPVSAILIIDVKKDQKVLHHIDLIAPGLNQLGVMIPYAPVFQLLMEDFQQPIVASSGNLSGEPITYREGDHERLFEVADFILTNNRDIVIPQDDSIIKYSSIHNQRIVIRRSRGLAPTFFTKFNMSSSKNILALGAMNKSTITWKHLNNVFVSQYLGDLNTLEVELTYKNLITHYFNIFNQNPELILTDFHPNYSSTRIGNGMAEQLEIPHKNIQHHQAHFAAVLGENSLLDSETKILGVVWDGTGMGDDYQIWGGEFFSYHQYDFVRLNHFQYFSHILGDKMPKEPRISALSLSINNKGAADILARKFTNREFKIYTKLLSVESNIQTSSVGRIFDAVASLLLLRDKQTYEGEAAMLLEDLANGYLRSNDLLSVKNLQPYSFYNNQFQIIDTQLLIEQLIGDILIGDSFDLIAMKFHYSLVMIIHQIAHQSGFKKIAFSGGVFQNALLIDLVIECLSSDFELYFHDQLSPNDESISFGQLMCYEIEHCKNRQL